MKVFLCHQSESKPFVCSLADELSKVNIGSWVDEAEIGPGESLFKRIAEGIHEECDAVIASVSRLALQSRWVEEELDHAKYSEITKPGFQLMVVLLGDVSPEELPKYLYNKKHILWEKGRPSGEESPHPGYRQIIRQLFKGKGGVGDDAAGDVSRLLERFLSLLYAYGNQREATGKTGPALWIYGEVRRDFSDMAIHAWSKYSRIAADPLVRDVRDIIAAIINADIGLRDWALGYSNCDFQKASVDDFLKVLTRVQPSIGIDEIGASVRRRIALQRDKSMASVYQLAHYQEKSRRDWAVDVGGQLHRFGL